MVATTPPSLRHPRPLGRIPLSTLHSPTRNSLTQVLDQPVSGRIYFEEVIREDLDIGRPKQVQLIFDRCVTKATPGPFRTRVITDGVVPSLHIDYKGTRIKQYHKEGRALHTETTINNTYDFYVGKNLRNLPALRRIGFEANRRLLQVLRISHDCILAEEAFEKINRPIRAACQRTSALRFADPQVQALWRALLLFQLLPTGFSNRDLRPHFASLLEQPAQSLSQGQRPRTGKYDRARVILARNGILRVNREMLAAPALTGDMKAQLEAREREAIEPALRASRGRVAGPNGAAKRLGMAPLTLEFRIRRLGVDKFHYRANSGHA